MKKENMRFGTLIKALRTEHDVTLKTMSEVLGISRSMLSDIEQNRRKPFDSEKIGKFASYFSLSEKDRAILYDAAAKEKGTVPYDLDDIMMHSEVGDLARQALRLTNDGAGDEADWKKFIRQLEANKQKRRE